MFFYKTPSLLPILFPQLLWHRPTKERVIYLTFDDGPVPDETNWVLGELRKYRAKATFFCVGDNIRKHPEIFQDILQEGHSIGNHTFNHLNAWKTDENTYRQNIALCQEIIHQFSGPSKECKLLFRPPYGRISPSLIHQLKPFYEIVMWDVLSGDYRHDISPEDCLQNTLKHIRKGSIVVFHDSPKAFRNLSFTLPRLLAHFSQQGYRFEKL